VKFRCHIAHVLSYRPNGPWNARRSSRWSCAYRASRDSREKPKTGIDHHLADVPNRLEQGHRNPTIVTLYELATALGVSPVDLIKRLGIWFCLSICSVFAIFWVCGPFCLLRLKAQPEERRDSYVTSPVGFGIFVHFRLSGGLVVKRFTRHLLAVGAPEGIKLIICT
jgi:hypothetical protein